jgi:hypothetical protein
MRPIAIAAIVAEEAALVAARDEGFVRVFG